MRSDCPQLEKLRNEVIAGTITDIDIQKRLSTAIEAEYLKPQPDAEFISLCEDMLWHIGTQGEQPLPSSTDRYLALIEQHMGGSSRKERMLHVGGFKLDLL